MHTDKHIGLSLTQGVTIRDLFYNGLLDYLLAAGLKITIFTEAINVPGFKEEWQRPGINFAPLYPYKLNTNQGRLFWLRRFFARHKQPVIFNLLRFIEKRWFYPPRQEYIEIMRAEKIEFLVLTHAHIEAETELLASAQALGIPSLGLVRSWDNIYKGITNHADNMAVWNDVNKQEIIDQEGYHADDVRVIGSPQFDAYFHKDTIWSKEKFFDHIKLDSARPVILFASLGYFFPPLDETVWMDCILEKIASGEIVGNPQIICRLHPWSRLEYFQKYEALPNVRLSYMNNYLPALTWYMTRDQVIEMANMIHHANVVITPGSTVTLEAAIFDCPTIVPIFHPYQPERAKSYFSRVLGRHYARIKHQQLIPIVENLADFAPLINKAIADKTWYQDQRKILVEDYVKYTDGCSTKRFVDFIVEQLP